MQETALFFIPIVILYRGWPYKLFSGGVTEEAIESGEAC
jgi:cytochrome bd-type quinol oxidase subunit 2